MANKPKTFLFDFGNVIIDIDIQGAIDRIGAFRKPSITPEEYRLRIMEVIRKYEVGAISTDLFINGILRYAHHSVQALDVIEAWNSMLIGIPPYRLAMLEQIRREYGVYMLSNINALHQQWIDRHLKETHQIDDLESRHFHELFYSHVIGHRKPDSDAFQYVIDTAFITPQNTLFIDDTVENLDMARTLGFQVLHSPPEHEITEYLKVQGYF